MKSTLITDRTGYPVTMEEVREHLRIDANDDEAYIATLIHAATDRIEKDTGRVLMSQTWRTFFDTWQDAAPPEQRGKNVSPWWEGVREGPVNMLTGVDTVALPKFPLSSVSYVKTWDDTDAGTTFAATSYYVDTVSEPGRIVLRKGKVWPTVERVANGIEIEYVAGYGARNDVPADIRHAMLIMISHWYENRESTSEKPMHAIPGQADKIIRQYANMRLA